MGDPVKLSHELREYVRYRRLGYEAGTPSNTEAATDLWRQTHSATLDDYNYRFNQMKCFIIRMH